MTLTNFGVNLVHLSPGAISSLRHAHANQDEFVYVVAGTASLISNEGETALKAGMCVGFKAGSGNAHQLVNRTESQVIFLEAGDRIVPDEITYPDDDLAISVDVAGKAHFRHKDGTNYDGWD